MREAQEVECLRLAPVPTSAVFAGETPEFNQPRLALVQLQAEAAQPVGYRTLEAPGIPQVSMAV
ncbi:hypothetical protein [Paraburkholderia humisilvae]|uniref:Uncharacterized protein n=1 Tax=Paraburkholderia humisilvae TaxID=627669 RepID=A0A6J5F7M7_9BURK|nr:hypothetical protein LMG29542_07256 [Paraburkholderia humisilvae]